jgi:membrane dipeptidase
VCLATCFDHWRRLLAASASFAPDATPAITRRGFLGLAAGAPLVATGCANTTPPPPGAVRSLLAVTPSFDLHSHPGLFPTLASDTLEGHCRAAETGAVKLIALTGTSDAPVLTRTSTGALRATRDPRTGELYASTWQQLNALTSWSEAAQMPHVRTAKDLLAVRQTGATSVRGLLATEGCDFLDGRLDRVQEAFDRGVRSMQLVHYRVNELGDIQTEAAVHGGLTSFGRDVVRELNRVRAVIDVAHATLATTAGVVETTTRPIILSHSNIQDATGWARFITPDHARLVARTGGVIGAMPIILGRRMGGTDIGGYVNHISRLVDVVGIDHVGIGTDMDGIGSASVFTSYTRWPSLAAALLGRGYGRLDVAKILGGNAMRVFRTVLPEA